MSILVVGAGQAALSIALNARTFGDTGPITLVGDEPYPPYERPPLSKSLLTSTAEPTLSNLRAAAWYADAGIDLVLGDRVTAIDRDAGLARTDAGQEIGFSGLAFATGGRPRRLPLPGADLAGVHYLRTYDDALALRASLLAARSVVVIGGGFIGLEIAAAACLHGRSVTVLEAADRLLGRAVAPVTSAFYLGAHQLRGATVVLDAKVEAIEGTGHVRGVSLAGGAVVDADLVVIGAGMEPHVEIAESIGVECHGGIVVDSGCRTNLRGVVAAGDCTAQPVRDAMLRVESVENATAQGKIAAATLVGADPGPRPVPWFWSDQADLKLQIAGINIGYDETVVRGRPAEESFAVFYYAGSELLACDAVNSPKEYMAVRMALGRGQTIPADRVADTDTPIKELIVTASPAS